MQTTFRPGIDGFAFSNEKWMLNDSERSDIHSLVVQELPKVVGVATPILLAASPLVIAILGPALIVAGPFLPLLLPIAIRKTIDSISDEIAANATTWCGGIAFAAMDYYLLNWALPRGSGPDDRPVSAGEPGATTGSDILHTYLWTRLLDCQLANLARASLWHLMNLIMGDFGGSYLRDQTQDAVLKVGQSIAAGTPCPIYLLSMGNDPSVDHVVIAICFQQMSLSVWRIDIYDVDVPDLEQYLIVDTTNSQLSISEPPRNNKKWAGLFVADYTPKQPMPAVVLASAVKVTPSNFNGVGRSVEASFTALNQGFHQTLPAKLCVCLAGTLLLP